MPYIIADGTPRRTEIFTRIKRRIRSRVAIVVHGMPTSGRQGFLIFTDQVTDQPIGRGLSAAELLRLPCVRLSQLAGERVQQIVELPVIGRCTIVRMLSCFTDKFRSNSNTTDLNVVLLLGCPFRQLVPCVATLHITIQTDQTRNNTHRGFRWEPRTRRHQSTNHIDHLLLIADRFAASVLDDFSLVVPHELTPLLVGDIEGKSHIGITVRSRVVRIII